MTDVMDCNNIMSQRGGNINEKRQNAKKENKAIVEKKEVSKNEDLNDDDLFGLIDLYFNRKFIMYSHNTNSFDKFIEEDIPNFLKKKNANIFQEKITRDNKNIIYKFEYDNILIKPPTIGKEGRFMFPSDARENNLTYSAKIVATVSQVQEIRDVATRKLESRKVIGEPENNVPIAIVPILVRSKFCTLNLKKDYDNTECDYDPGCYFIVNGAEKVVISQERKCENKPLVFIKKDSSAQTYVVQLMSKSLAANGEMQAMMIELKNNGSINMKVPILSEFPVSILFRALGVGSDREIIDYIIPDKNDSDMMSMVVRAIRLSTDDKGNNVTTQDEAINYLACKIRVIKKYSYSETDKKIRQMQKRIHLEYLLENNFLPHVTGGRKDKIFYLGYMINKLLNCFLGRVPPDDRDSYLNKRVSLVGDLLDELFRQFYRKLLNECNKYFKHQNPSDEEPINIINQIRPNTIEQGINAALRTGTWINKRGVAQVLNRLTYLQAIEFFRRIDSPSNDASSSKLTHPRHLHGSQNGMLCCVETPEHAKVGLVKHLTIIGNVTVSSLSQTYLVRNIVKDMIIPLSGIDQTQLIKYTKVFVGGDWMGVTTEPIKIFNELKTMKYNGTFESTTSIILDDETNEIRINYDSGRLFRPVIRVINNNILLTREHIQNISLNKAKSETMITTWDTFMHRYGGVIEYIDPEEQAFSMISPNVQTVYNVKKIEQQSLIKAQQSKELNKSNRYGDMTFVSYSHCELHPSLLLGAIATNIPFLEHNQGPRNIFQYAQGRQAMCIYASNYRYRLDTSFILYNPAKPLVNTRTSKYMYNDVLSPGENAVVAIACYTGHNQEDAIVFNKSAIDRGLFRSTSFNKYISILQKNQSTSQDEMFMKPDRTKVAGMKKGSYDKINEKGYVPEETTVVNGDFLIGKVSPIQQSAQNNKLYKDNSEAYRQHVPGVVDKVYSDIRNAEQYEMIKIRVRSERVPTIGDKMCCYSPDHEVLTTDGWIPINQITLDHKIACLDNGNKLVYRKPMEIQSYDYVGQMYVVDSNQVKLCVTPNHRMYVHNCETNTHQVIEAQYIQNKDVKYVNTVKFYDNPNSCQSLNSKDDVIRTNLPKYVWSLNRIQSKIFINSITTHIPENPEMRYFGTSQKSVADDLQILCLHAGYSAIITYDRYYNVEISTSPHKCKVTKDNNKYVEYSGKVYCCSVGGDGIIYVRRNGCPIWCGNSRHG